MSDEDYKDGEENRVLRLVPKQPPSVQPQIVGILSEMLERAKQGQFQSIAIAACMEEEGATIKWSTVTNVPHRLLLVGALTLLERELLSDIHTRR